MERRTSSNRIRTQGQNGSACEECWRRAFESWPTIEASIKTSSTGGQSERQGRVADIGTDGPVSCRTPSGHATRVHGGARHHGERRPVCTQARAVRRVRQTRLLPHKLLRFSPQRSRIPVHTRLVPNSHARSPSFSAEPLFIKLHLCGVSTKRSSFLDASATPYLRCESCVPVGKSSFVGQPYLEVVLRVLIPMGYTHDVGLFMATEKQI